MRNAEQLLQSGFGDPDFRLAKGAVRSQGSRCQIYEVELPKAFQRGLPPMWRFGIVEKSSSGIGAQEKQRLLAEITDEISKHDPSRGIPLVFLSDEGSIRLSDELQHSNPQVFFVDEPELPGRPRQALQPRATPILLAVRRTLSQRQSALLLCPYLPNKPVDRWRFFGRRRELQRLIQSPENFLVVGARRIGKTSLLKEAAHRMAALGYRALYINVQDLRSEAQLVERILRTVSSRDYYKTTRREAAPERTLLTVLRRTAAGGNFVLIIDELGNIITQMGAERWHVFGVLRSFAQSGEIRLIGSGFQEILLQQQEDFSGPWVNFASMMRLSGFSIEEVNDFIVSPIRTWAEVRNSNALRDLVVKAVGTHPLALQYFGHALFQEVVQGEEGDVMSAANFIVGAGILEYFKDAVQQIFYDIPSSIIKYIFLSACHDASMRGRPPHAVVVTDDWVEAALKGAGWESSTFARRNMLQALEVRGLTHSEGGDFAEQKILVPLVYRYLKRSETDLDGYLEKLRREVSFEATSWRLQRPGGVAAHTEEAPMTDRN